MELTQPEYEVMILLLGGNVEVKHVHYVKMVIIL